MKLPKESPDSHMDSQPPAERRHTFGTPAPLSSLSLESEDGSGEHTLCSTASTGSKNNECPIFLEPERQDFKMHGAPPLQNKSDYGMLKILPRRSPSPEYKSDYGMFDLLSRPASPEPKSDYGMMQRITFPPPEPLHNFGMSHKILNSPLEQKHDYGIRRAQSPPPRDECSLGALKMPSPSPQGESDIGAGAPSPPSVQKPLSPEHQGSPARLQRGDLASGSPLLHADDFGDSAPNGGPSQTGHQPPADAQELIGSSSKARCEFHANDPCPLHLTLFHFTQLGNGEVARLLLGLESQKVSPAKSKSAGCMSRFVEAFNSGLAADHLALGQSPSP
jgi:hypothetical protein